MDRQHDSKILNEAIVAQNFTWTKKLKRICDIIVNEYVLKTFLYYVTLRGTQWPSF